ncbi:hypothetical protein DPMN_014028 [Dreissena polymorpha]|uniref:Uncharacterized protein n=1 Tax=Dreissena polymorpha TaxID=45954 RepID=A0A9D4N8V2_DREPO|nr:hypothetical protein DPMN_014028 [Dreissena polymorpha]
MAFSVVAANTVSTDTFLSSATSLAALWIWHGDDHSLPGKGKYGASVSKSNLLS